MLPEVETEPKNANEPGKPDIQNQIFGKTFKTEIIRQKTPVWILSY